jgi:hypothetical protein
MINAYPPQMSETGGSSAGERASDAPGHRGPTTGASGRARGPRAYSGGASTLARASLATDNVFSDDRAIHQLGSVDNGVVANLTIAVR